MPDIDALQHYFDAIIEYELELDDVLAGDKQRYKLFKQAQQLLIHLSKSLNQRESKDNVIKAMQHSISKLSKLSYGDLDNLIRSYVVESMDADDGDTVSDYLLLSCGAEVSDVTHMQWVQPELVMYQDIETLFKQAKKGVITKDKRMIEILKGYKIKRQKGDEVELVKRTPSKTKKSRNIDL